MEVTWTDKIFEDIVETIRESLLVLDQDLRVISASRSFYEFFKATPEETVGQLIYDLGNKQWDIPKLRELLETILPQKATFDNYEVEHDFATIGRRIMLLNARQIERGEGEERIILLAIEDITERKQIEAGLEKTRKELAAIKKTADEAHEFAESLINTVREPLIALDQDLRVVNVSRSFYEFFKVKPEETVGQLIYDLGNKQWDIPKLRELLETILPQKTSFDNYEVEHDFATIGRRIMLLNARQIERGKGEERIILLAIEDITERKRLEKDLLRVQKLESVGLLAGGIAHDYNNLLAVIMGNLSMAQEEAVPHSAMAELLHEIEQASYKARDLTHQFLTLSQGGHPRKEPGSMESLLKEILEQVQTHEVSTTSSIQDDLWPVEYDSKQMHLAISNVIINAAEAMPQGGTIALQAENLVIENKDKEFALFLDQGKYVRISIQDEGRGIPEEHLSRIFDPYFSTKERGDQKGMGLGLATAYAVVQKHGGHIMVNSTIGVGTTVTIYLPASERPESKAPNAQRNDVGPQSTIANQQSTIQKILVMDDEEMLRNLARRMLERLGYEVETVKDGVEAIEIYNNHLDSGEHFDGVILDLTIKDGMGGEQAIKELLKIDPDVNAHDKGFLSPP